MLVIGPYEALIQRKNLAVLNLTSLIEGYEKLDLVPPYGTGYNDEKVFDMNYANYIMNDDAKFLNFMKIMFPIFDGMDVYILISNNPMFEFISDSLQKFIQQRYGYISNIISSQEDWECVQDSNFTLNGIYNFDIDKERFLSIYSQMVSIEDMNKYVRE